MLAPTSSVPTASTTMIAPAARWPDRSAHRINGVAAPAVNAPMEDGMAKPSVGTRARSAGGRDRPINSFGGRHGEAVRRYQSQIGRRPGPADKFLGVLRDSGGGDRGEHRG